MGGKKLLQRLLRMKGFRITWFELHERKREVLIGVKPHKTGCRCPHCDRRCEIVTILPECRVWRDVVLCGMEVFFLSSQRDSVSYPWSSSGEHSVVGRVCTNHLSA
jgi:transposase